MTVTEDDIKAAGERAAALFYEGYNCSQSVFGALAPYFDMDFETALRVSASFGGGMGRLRHVCGAVSGAFMAIGMYNGCTDPKDRAGKTANYALVRKFAEDFTSVRGSIVCREILHIAPDQNAAPSERTAEFYKTRPCAEIIRESASLALRLISLNPPQQPC